MIRYSSTKQTEFLQVGETASSPASGGGASSCANSTAAGEQVKVKRETPKIMQVQAEETQRQEVGTKQTAQPVAKLVPLVARLVQVVPLVARRQIAAVIRAPPVMLELQVRDEPQIKWIPNIT